MGFAMSGRARGRGEFVNLSLSRGRVSNWSSPPSLRKRSTTLTDSIDNNVGSVFCVRYGSGMCTRHPTPWHFV